MRRRRLVGTASAVTMATLATAVTAWAEPAVPTFAGGLSQPVFAQGSANWVNHEPWVETDMDTDTYFPADVRFRQSIGAREGLRTGVYSKTLTFTLSTTQP